MRTVLHRLIDALDDRREVLDVEHRAAIDVLYALACVLPPALLRSFGEHRRIAAQYERFVAAQREDTSEFARHARRLLKKYRITTRSRFGEAVERIVEEVARRVNAPPHAARSRMPRPPLQWRQGETDTPRGRHTVFARLIAPRLRDAARDVVPALHLPETESLEKILREHKKLTRLIEAKDTQKLAAAVLVGRL